MIEIEKFNALNYDIRKRYLDLSRKTKKWEKGYVNDKDDLGGETIDGISRKNFPDSKIWGIVDDYKKSTEAFTSLEKGTQAYNKQIYNLSIGNVQYKQLMHAFYYFNFWSELGCGDIKEDINAMALFDLSVNSGIRRAINLSFDVLKKDGNLVFLINEYGEEFCNKLCEERKKFLERIIAKRPVLAKFRNGWLNRVNDFIV